MARDGDWRTVRLLSATSLLADLSGEIVTALLPFIVVAQGGAGLALGLVGGLSDAVGHLVKLPGGWLGDRVHHKRWLVASGYLLAAGSRFGIALGGSAFATGFFRSLDRVGKGIRSAPRDAMLAGAVPTASRGRAFGYHRAADTLGAVFGVVIALVLTGVLDASLQRSILVAAFIGLVAAVPLLFVHEPELRAKHRRIMESLSKPARAFLAIAVLHSLGQVSLLFFLVRTTQGGLSVTAAVAWYLVFNIVYFVASYPAGMMADYFGKPRTLALGFLVSAAAAACFIPSPETWSLALGFPLLGVGYAATEGLGRAIAADLAGSEARSTQLGWYHASTGFAALAGAVVAGLLWDIIDPWAAFAWGVGLSALAAVVLALNEGWLARAAT